MTTLTVTEVRFPRGKGVQGDPVREIVAYHDAYGILLAEHDTWLDGLSAEGWRQWFMSRGWSIDLGSGPSPDPFVELAALREWPAS